MKLWINLKNWQKIAFLVLLILGVVFGGFSIKSSLRGIILDSGSSNNPDIDNGNNPKVEKVVTKHSASPMSLVTKIGVTSDINMSPSPSPVSQIDPTPSFPSSYLLANQSDSGTSGSSESMATPPPSLVTTPTSSPIPSETPLSSPIYSETPAPSVTSTPLPSAQAGGGGPTPGSESTIAVVINEIGWMGTEKSPSDEWIELYNTANHPVSLDGWILKSETDGSPNINLNGTINSHDYYLIERTNDETISDITANLTTSFGTGGLKNTGEKLVLRDQNGDAKDSVDGSSGWYAGENSTKSSMERINPKENGGRSNNWATNDGITKNGLDAGNNKISGTPKARNSTADLSTI